MTTTTESSFEPHPVSVSAPRTSERVYTNADGTTYALTGGSRAWRDNNPGNITNAGLFAKTHGAIGVDTMKVQAGQNPYAIFPNAQAGWDALQGLITQVYAKEGLTVEQMMKKYAPKGSGPHPLNNTAAYLKFVCDKAHVTAGALVSSLNKTQVKALEHSIASEEGWYSPGPGVISGTLEIPGGSLTQAAVQAFTYDAMGVGGGPTGPQLFSVGSGVSVGPIPNVNPPRPSVQIVDQGGKAGVTATFDYTPMTGGGYVDNYHGKNQAGTEYNWVAELTAKGHYTLQSQTNTAHGAQATKTVSATRNDPSVKTTGRTSAGAKYTTSYRTTAGGAYSNHFQINTSKRTGGATVGFSYTPTAGGGKYTTSGRTDSKDASLTLNGSSTGHGAYSLSTVIKTSGGTYQDDAQKHTTGGATTTTRDAYTAKGDFTVYRKDLGGTSYGTGTKLYADSVINTIGGSHYSIITKKTTNGAYSANTAGKSIHGDTFTRTRHVSAGLNQTAHSTNRNTPNGDYTKTNSKTPANGHNSRIYSTKTASRTVSGTYAQTGLVVSSIFSTATPQGVHMKRTVDTYATGGGYRHTVGKSAGGVTYAYTQKNTEGGAGYSKDSTGNGSTYYAQITAGGTRYTHGKTPGGVTHHNTFYA